MSWTKPLPSVGQSAWGTPLDDVISEIRTRIEALEAAGQAVTGVNSITFNSSGQLQGDVDLSNLVADKVHKHAGDDITSGTVPIARLDVHNPVVYVKADGGFGASAGSFPATRTAITADTTRPIIYVANTDPGTALMDDERDVWIIVP